MKKNYLVVVALLFVLGGCAEAPTEFSYGTKGVIFPGDGKIKPVFTGKEPKGTFTVYPSTIAMDPATGVIDVDSKVTIPGYKYLVRFVSEGGKEMAHTYVEVAGVRYPSRYFDITNPADTVAKLLLPDNEVDKTDGKFTIVNFALSDLVFSTTQRRASVDTAAAVQRIINGQTGALNLRDLVGGVFGEAVSGKIELTVQYETTQYGKPISGQTQYILFRQAIENPEYRTLLRDWANFDKIIEARQYELMADKKVDGINVQKTWGVGYAPRQVKENTIFWLTRAQQDAPPPKARGGI